MNNFSVSACADSVFRVVWQPSGDFDPQEVRTWSVVGNIGSIPRFHRSGVPRSEVLEKCFVPPSANMNETKNVRAVLGDNGVEWQFASQHGWISFLRDIHYRLEPDDGSFGFGRSLLHRFDRKVDDHFYGVGETSGSLDKKGRRFRMRPMDCMGYSATTSDPLYKHLPFLIVYRKELGLYFGLFYDTTHECIFDLGCEVNNYHGPYTTFATKSTSLDYYLVFGPTLDDVVTTFALKVVGTIPIQPSWTFGYMGSAMGYTDDPQAQEALKKFVRRCEEYNVPCSAFHLSSGYTMSDEGLRYVFVWNTKRVPSPHELVQFFHQHGIRLIANIKPALLESHPMFDNCNKSGLFIGSRENPELPELAQFWGGLAAHLDFTNDKTVHFWTEQLRNTLLDIGIDASWNDNNEFTDTYGQTCNGQSLRGLRPLQTLLMTGASYEAQLKARAPDDIFVLTRSGMYGSHRIASTWTGDNFTSWETLNFNLAMGLSLAISGWSNIGHDVGGFAGPLPSKELFFKWVQQGIFHPRFTIHSWKSNGMENSCWMFEDDAELTSRICSLTRFRHRMIPWLAEINRMSSLTGRPMIAPLLYYHPFEEMVLNHHKSFYFGEDTIVSPSVVESETVVTVLLPPGLWWTLDGSQCILASTFDFFRHPASDGSFLPPLFVRGGAEICMYDETFDHIEYHSFPSSKDGSKTIRT